MKISSAYMKKIDRRLSVAHRLFNGIRVYLVVTPLRHDDEDLHFGQIRSPAHSLLNGVRQARQLRTLGATSASGPGFLSLMKNS